MLHFTYRHLNSQALACLSQLLLPTFRPRLPCYMLRFPGKMAYLRDCCRPLSAQKNSSITLSTHQPPTDANDDDDDVVVADTG